MQIFAWDDIRALDPWDLIIAVLHSSLQPTQEIQR